jgi:hypothetical protein
MAIGTLRGGVRISKMSDIDDFAKQVRETLFSNESFLLAMIQAIDLAILGFVFYNSQAINEAGTFSPLSLNIKIFITFLLVSLISAILAAFLKHEYQKWNLHTISSHHQKNIRRRDACAKWAIICLEATRFFMIFSVLLLVVSFVLVILNIWFFA